MAGMPMMSFAEAQAMHEIHDHHAMKDISGVKLKAMAMRLRHHATGYSFKDKVAGDAESGAEPLLLASRAELKEAQSIQEHEGHNNVVGLKGIFLDPFCLPLVCVPLGIASGYFEWGTSWTFWLNLLSLVPLAKVLGDATEELAASLKSDTISGLLNATFGNAVEMIVSVQSIRHGLFDVVKASLLGSILSNILLVLGSSFLLGGLSKSKSKRGAFHAINDVNWKMRLVGLEKEQKFPVKTAMINMSLLLFACMTVVLPTTFAATPGAEEKHSASILLVSRIGAFVAGLSYVMYLVFQLLTHHVTLALEEKMDQFVTMQPTMMDTGEKSSGSLSKSKAAVEEDDGDDEDEGASISIGCALMLMFIATLVVSVNSEYLVDTLQEVAEKSHIPKDFIGVILLPIAGNACEHAAALRFCFRDRPGLAIGIAVGSSTQVALFVIPFSVIVGYFLDVPLNLDFGVLNMGVMTFSVLVVTVLLLDGRANWFKGYVMISMYIFLAALYWCLPPQFDAH